MGAVISGPEYDPFEPIKPVPASGELPRASAPLPLAEHARQLGSEEVVRLRTACSLKRGARLQWSMQEPVIVKRNTCYIGNVARNAGHRICKAADESHDLCFLGLVAFDSLDDEAKKLITGAERAEAPSEIFTAELVSKPFEYHPAAFYAVFADLSAEGRFSIVRPA